MHCAGVRQTSERIFNASCSAEMASPWAPQSVDLDGDTRSTRQLSDPPHLATSEAPLQPPLDGNRCNEPSMIWTADALKRSGLAGNAGVASPSASIGRGAVNDRQTRSPPDRQLLATEKNPDGPTDASGAPLSMKNGARPHFSPCNDGESDESQASPHRTAAATASTKCVMLIGDKQPVVEVIQIGEVEKSAGVETRVESEAVPIEPLPRILSKPWAVRVKKEKRVPNVTTPHHASNGTDGVSKAVAPLEFTSLKGAGEIEVGAGNSFIKSRPRREETPYAGFMHGDEAVIQGVPHANIDLASALRKPQIDTSDASGSDGMLGDSNFTVAGDDVSAQGPDGDGLLTAQERSTITTDTDSSSLVMEEAAADYGRGPHLGVRSRDTMEQIGTGELCVGTTRSTDHIVGVITEEPTLLEKGASQSIWPRETLIEQAASGKKPGDASLGETLALSRTLSNEETVAPKTRKSCEPPTSVNDSSSVKAATAAAETSAMAPHGDIAEPVQTDAPLNAKMPNEPLMDFSAAVAQSSETERTAESFATSTPEEVVEGDGARGTLECERTPLDPPRPSSDDARTQEQTSDRGSRCVKSMNSSKPLGMMTCAVNASTAVRDSSERKTHTVPVDCLGYVSPPDATRRAGEMKVSVITPQGGIDAWPSPNGQLSPGITVAEAAALMGSRPGHTFASGSSWGTNAASVVIDGDRVESSHLTRTPSRSQLGPTQRNPLTASESSLDSVGTDMRSASFAAAIAMATAAINAADARCAASSSFPGADAFLSPSLEVDTGTLVEIQRAKSHDLVVCDNLRSSMVNAERKRHAARVSAVAAPRAVEQAVEWRSGALDAKDAVANPTTAVSAGALQARLEQDGRVHLKEVRLPGPDRRRENAPSGASESGTSVLSNPLFENRHANKTAAVLVSKHDDSKVETQDRKLDERELSKTGVGVAPEAPSGVGAARLGDELSAGSANRSGGKHQPTAGAGHCCVLS